MTEAEFCIVPITQLAPHPDNPRLQLRQDVVEILATSLRERGFSQEHALLVRPFGDGYQVISGHHRLAAAQQAGLAELPCWVREMSDDEAFLGLIQNNTQGELSGLEVGMAALRYREKGTGGRGNVGGMSAYARAIGRDPSYVGRLAAAAQVYEAVGQAFPQVEQWDGLMRHLAEIARAPTHFWLMLVDLLLKERWSVEETHRAVGQVKTFLLQDGERIGPPIPKNELSVLQQDVRLRGWEWNGELRIGRQVYAVEVTRPGKKPTLFGKQELEEVLSSSPRLYDEDDAGEGEECVDAVPVPFLIRSALLGWKIVFDRRHGMYHLYTPGGVRHSCHNEEQVEALLQQSEEAKQQIVEHLLEALPRLREQAKQNGDGEAVARLEMLLVHHCAHLSRFTQDREFVW